MSLTLSFNIWNPSKTRTSENMTVDEELDSKIDKKLREKSKMQKKYKNML